MPARAGGQVPYSKRNDYAPAPADSRPTILRDWWPRPIAWRGLDFVADDACDDCWRTPRESVDDPWCWCLLHMPYNPEASWAGHLRLGGDRYYGRGHSPAEALEAAIVQARWAVRAVEDALRQVGEVIAP
jgi:hypothetical protein